MNQLDELVQQMQGPVDPLAVACPRCEQPAGKPCRSVVRPTSEPKAFPHPDRVDAAREVITLEEVKEALQEGGRVRAAAERMQKRAPRR